MAVKVNFNTPTFAYICYMIRNCVVLVMFASSLSVLGQLDSKGIYVFELDKNDIDAATNFQLKRLTNKPSLTSIYVSPKFLTQPLSSADNKKKGISMIDPKPLPSPKWTMKPQFQEGKSNLEQFSRDYDMGDISTTSRVIKIACRDHEYEDGDRVRLIHNGKIVHPNLTLRNAVVYIEISLNDGFNALEFFALNEGSSRPNTAEMKVLDENEIVIASHQWLLTTGYTARLLVLKK